MNEVAELVEEGEFTNFKGKEIKGNQSFKTLTLKEPLVIP